MTEEKTVSVSGLTSSATYPTRFGDKDVRIIVNAVPSWQPIETAPKDGTAILVWLDVATVPIVHIAWYRSAEEWDESGQHCGGWESLEDWEGWWSYTRGSVTQEKLEGYSMPTHWMPLPKPPLPS